MVQQLVSLLKTLALLSLAAAALVITIPPASAPAPSSLPHGLPLAAALVLAFQGVMFTYDGWNGMLYFSGR